MERGIITITETGVALTGNVWMTDYEITDLFGVTFSAINSQIKAIFKSGVLREHDTCQYTHLENGNRADTYNMDCHRIPIEQPARQHIPAVDSKKGGNTHTFSPTYRPSTERWVFVLRMSRFICYDKPATFLLIITLNFIVI